MSARSIKMAKWLIIILSVIVAAVLGWLVASLFISSSTQYALAAPLSTQDQEMSYSTLNGAWQPGDVAKLEDLWVNVSNRVGGQLSGKPLNDLVKSFTKQGYTPQYPIRWSDQWQIYYLIFTRVAQYRNGIFISVLWGVYWDYNGNCPRYKDGRPFGNATCSNQVSTLQIPTASILINAMQGIKLPYTCVRVCKVCISYPFKPGWCECKKPFMCFGG